MVQLIQKNKIKQENTNKQEACTSESNMPGYNAHTKNNEYDNCECKSFKYIQDLIAEYGGLPKKGKSTSIIPTIDGLICNVRRGKIDLKHARCICSLLQLKLKAKEIESKGNTQGNQQLFERLTDFGTILHIVLDDADRSESSDETKPEKPFFEELGLTKEEAEKELDEAKEAMKTSRAKLKLKKEEQAA